LRLDLFLKRCGLIKRRLHAKQLCEAGGVELNGRPARASREAGPGDLLFLRLPHRSVRIRILSIPDRSMKPSDGRAFYELLEETRTSAEEPPLC
jgi:ribosomal 50S subunit-recycling heat shock protein